MTWDQSPGGDFPTPLDLPYTGVSAVIALLPLSDPEDVPLSSPNPSTEPRTRRLLRLAALSSLVAIGLVALAVLPIWLVTWYETLIPRAWRRAAITAFLQTLRATYLFAVLAAPLTALACLGILKRARGSGRRAPRAARGLLLGLSTTLGLIGLEAASAAWLSWTHRLPEFPTEFEEPRRIESIPTEFPEGDSTGPIHLVIVGESSAEGQPYHPRLSVAQLIAWQLERIFPERKVRVTILAGGGIALEQAALRLYELDERPDALIVYAGHNEFQARYGWSRVVRHYLDEEPVAVRTALGRGLGKYSAVCELIAEALDRQQVDRPPPKDPERHPIDHPAYTPEEYEFLRDDFARRLDGLAAYARKVDALPILIAPPGNLAEYPPARSYLDPSADAATRDAVTSALLAAMAREGSDPDAAEAEYRRLATLHPEHAEARYRLARRLAAQGRIDEARPHFEAARDLDGMPMRCPGDFLAAYPEAARRHDALLIDGSTVLQDLTTDGLLDLRVFHDAQHPTLRGYIALAQAVLDGLAERRAFGWPQGVAVPRIDPAEAEAHFQIDPEWWAVVCMRSSVFYTRIAGIRYDPAEHEALSDLWERAAHAIRGGAELGSLEVPGLGIEPAGLVEPSSAAPPLSAGSAVGPQPSPVPAD